MRYFVLTIIILLCSCASVQTDVSKQSQVASSTTESSQSEERIPRSKRVYYFQHKLIPRWLYESDGEFFKDVMDGHIGQLQEVAVDLIDEKFASALDIRVLHEKNAVLFIFEKPRAFPNCYYAIAQSSGESFSYTTFESTLSIGDTQLGGVVGGWSPNGDHLNLGGRLYSSSEDFVKDVLGVN